MVRRLFGGSKNDDEDEGLSTQSRRVLKPGQAPQAAADPSLAGVQAGTPPSASASRGMVLVKHPDGGESRLDVSAKPVTIGRWEKCDIQLDDDSIRPVHVRVVALADGEFRVHGVAAPSLRPYATNVERPDEFMVAQSGDQVTLPGGKGEYVIHFLSTEAARNLDSPATDEQTTSSSADAADAPSVEPPPTEQPPTDPGAVPPPPASS